MINISATKEEKLLTSIDGTLKDILKELKKANRTHLVIDGGTFTEKDLEELKKTKVMPL